jgi:hypothetical protein
MDAGGFAERERLEGAWIDGFFHEPVTYVVPAS